MRPDRPPLTDRLRGWLLMLAAGALLSGCGAPPPTHVAVAPSDIASQPGPQSKTAPDARAASASCTAAAPCALQQALAYADRVRGMQPAELGQAIAGLGDGGNTALGIMQLSLALAQARSASSNARAQMLLQRLLGRDDEQARLLHPLARLLSAQLSESKHSDELLDRQAQLLRDAQRRIEQLNERLEAVRAIERSVPSRPAAGASGPAVRR